MTADYSFKWIMAICRKHQFGEIQPDLFNKAVSTACDSYYDWLIGQLEQYKAGKPVPVVGAGMSTKISRWLMPLFHNPVIAVTSNIVVYPTDLDYHVALIDDASKKNIERIEYTKLSGRLGSKIDPVTDTSSPFYSEDDTGWLIYPTSVANVQVVYYSRPPEVVWGYTVNAQGRAIYNQGASVDPVFDDVSMRKVLARAIRLMGFSFTEPDWVAYGNEVKQGGE